MVSSEGLVYNMKLSTVGLSTMSDPDMVFVPNGMDLAMKLHYIKVVYYFEGGPFDGMDSQAIKEPIFKWLTQFPGPCGRFRRDKSGRPYVKCNDCGARLVEAKCDKTINEWLEIKDANLEKFLVPNECIGPELGFSPPIFLQFTNFKCGGMAVGLNWAHVLGDAFSAAEFMNTLGHVVAGYEPGRPVRMTHIEKLPSISIGSPEKAKYPLSIKRVSPVGDYWLNATDCKMEAFSFDVNPKKLSDLQSNSSQHGDILPPFDVFSAFIWQCIAKIRGETLEPNFVTVIRKGEQNNNKSDEIMSNTQVVTVVKADFSIRGAKLSDLAALMKKEVLDERKKIEEAMEREHGLGDVMVYGANLTFVNLEEAKFYEFEFKGYNPLNVSCRIDEVGEQGAVFVLPVRNSGDRMSVMTILTQNEAAELKAELTKEGLVA